MQAMCCRQCPRRIRYHPAEIKTVLMALSEAFSAGRSEMVIEDTGHIRRRRRIALMGSMLEIASPRPTETRAAHSPPSAKAAESVAVILSALDLATAISRERDAPARSRSFSHFCFGAAGISRTRASAGSGAPRVVEELQKRGIEASVRRLTLDPFRGLIAQDVRIYDSEKSR